MLSPSDVDPLAPPSVCFSDVEDVDLNSNVYFDEQAQQWALEVNYRDQWLFIGFSRTEEKANLMADSITLAELQLLAAKHP